MAYLRVHNPDDKDKLLVAGGQEVVIPSRKSVVVESSIGQILKEMSAALEVVSASDEEYAVFINPPKPSKAAKTPKKKLGKAKKGAKQ